MAAPSPQCLLERDPQRPATEPPFRQQRQHRSQHRIGADHRTIDFGATQPAHDLPRRDPRHRLHHRVALVAAQAHRQRHRDVFGDRRVGAPAGAFPHHVGDRARQRVGDGEPMRSFVAQHRHRPEPGAQLGAGGEVAGGDLQQRPVELLFLGLQVIGASAQPDRRRAGRQEPFPRQARDLARQVEHGAGRALAVLHAARRPQQLAAPEQIGMPLHAAQVRPPRRSSHRHRHPGERGRRAQPRLFVGQHRQRLGGTGETAPPPSARTAMPSRCSGVLTGPRHRAQNSGCARVRSGPSAIIIAASTPLLEHRLLLRQPVEQPLVLGHATGEHGCRQHQQSVLAVRLVLVDQLPQQRHCRAPEGRLPILPAGVRVRSQQQCDHPLAYPFASALQPADPTDRRGILGEEGLRQPQQQADSRGPRPWGPTGDGSSESCT